MKASLQLLTPAPHLLCLLLQGGSWRDQSDYDGVAMIQIYGAIAVMRRLLMRHDAGNNVERITITPRELRPLGVRALIGIHGANTRLMIWMVPT